MLKFTHLKSYKTFLIKENIQSSLRNILPKKLKKSFRLVQNKRARATHVLGACAFRLLPLDGRRAKRSSFFFSR